MRLIKDEKDIYFGLRLAYIILAIFASYFVGSRSEDIGTDTGNYLYYFNAISNSEKLDPGFDRIEIGFFWITKIISLFTQSPSIYLAIIFMIQFVGITGPFFRRSELFDKYFLLSFVWLSYPFFYSITLNVLRQGVAFVFVIYAVDRYLCGERKSAYLLALTGVAFHYVTIIYFIAFLFGDLKIRTLLIFWLGCVFLAMTGAVGYFFTFLEKLMNSFGVNDYYLSYFNGVMSSEYVTGFKPEFFLASITPIFCVYLFMWLGFDISKNNLRLLKIYIIIHSLYFLFTELPYNDRFAIASWLFIPYIITNIIYNNLNTFFPFVVVVPFFAILLFYYQVIGL